MLIGGYFHRHIIDVEVNQLTIIMNRLSKITPLYKLNPNNVENLKENYYHFPIFLDDALILNNIYIKEGQEGDEIIRNVLLDYFRIN